MNLGLTLRIALRALARNKLRTLLTMLGIIIGVAAVIAMLSIGNGAQLAVQERISAMGTNTVFIWPGHRRGRSRGGSDSGTRLTVADWKAVDRLPEVQLSSPMANSSASLVYASANWTTSLTGTNPAYFEIMNWGVTSGRLFSESEVNSGANVIVLGSQVRDELFGSTDPVGSTIRVRNIPFRVIGVLEEKGSGGFGNRDNTALMPYTTLMRKIDGTDRLSYLTLQAPTQDRVREVETIAVEVLNERYRITDPKSGGFSAYNQAEASEVAGESTRVFSLLLGGIASVSLLVGGIGIMNIMLVSVTERIREIGIRMAVGARGRDILAQFLVESIVLSLAGGAIGVLLGGGVSVLIASLAGWPTVISESSVVLAFGTSALIGIFFGFYPALSASRLDPIQALRNE